MLVMLILVSAFFLGLAAYFWGEAVKYRERSEHLRMKIRRQEERERQLGLKKWGM